MQIFDTRWRWHAVDSFSKFKAKVLLGSQCNKKQSCRAFRDLLFSAIKYIKWQILKGVNNKIVFGLTTRGDASAALGLGRQLARCPVGADVPAIILGRSVHNPVETGALLNQRRTRRSAAGWRRQYDAHPRLDRLFQGIGAGTGAPLWPRRRLAVHRAWNVTTAPTNGLFRQHGTPESRAARKSIF